VTDNVVRFPGTDEPSSPESNVTVESVLDAARDRYDDVILIGRNKGTGMYECVSTTEVTETFFHITRIQHRLNLFLDGRSDRD
jgi:hypothetical protein